MSKQCCINVQNNVELTSKQCWINVQTMLYWRPKQHCVNVKMCLLGRFKSFKYTFLFKFMPLTIMNYFEFHFLLNSIFPTCDLLPVFKEHSILHSSNIRSCSAYCGVILGWFLDWLPVNTCSCRSRYHHCPDYDYI